MTVITQITIAVALVLSIILPFGYYLIGEKTAALQNSLGVKPSSSLDHAYRHCRNVHR